MFGISFEDLDENLNIQWPKWAFGLQSWPRPPKGVIMTLTLALAATVSTCKYSHVLYQIEILDVYFNNIQSMSELSLIHL